MKNDRRSALYSEAYSYYRMKGASHRNALRWGKKKVLRMDNPNYKPQKMR